MEAHVGVDIERSRAGTVTIVGLTSGMAADVSGLVWEGDVLEAGNQRFKLTAVTLLACCPSSRSIITLHHHAPSSRSIITLHHHAPSSRSIITLHHHAPTLTSLRAVNGVLVCDLSPMKVHRLLSGPPGSEVVSDCCLRQCSSNAPPHYSYPPAPSAAEYCRQHRLRASQRATHSHRPPAASWRCG
jgi:hypothetical protein